MIVLQFSWCHVADNRRSTGPQVTYSGSRWIYTLYSAPRRDFSVLRLYRGKILAGGLLLVETADRSDPSPIRLLSHVVTWMGMDTVKSHKSSMMLYLRLSKSKSPKVQPQTVLQILTSHPRYPKNDDPQELECKSIIFRRKSFVGIQRDSTNQ